MSDDLTLAAVDREEADTFPPGIEPEYVGAHSERAEPWCVHRKGPKGREECDNWSTHTVVMKDQNGLHEVASCDECGEPEDVTTDTRDWSGRVDYDG